MEENDLLQKTISNFIKTLEKESGRLLVLSEKGKLTKEDLAMFNENTRALKFLASTNVMLFDEGKKHTTTSGN